ncbi:MAG: hypothetical protein Kow002_02970 [Anaerolineales bacterium]
MVSPNKFENEILQSQIWFNKITSHNFVKVGFDNAVKISQELQTDDISKVTADYIRAPNELEFYIINVGRTLAHLLSMCEQLVHAVLFLSAFSPTKRMKEARITRSTHLQYNIENYLIRTQSVHDRTLKLVNSVFHLGLQPRDCRHDTIAKNLHVKPTRIPGSLKNIRKLLLQYQQERNSVVHHEGYQDDKLRSLEMFYIAKEIEEGKGESSLDDFQYMGRRLTKEVVTQKMDEFDKFNGELFSQLIILFDNLEKEFHQRMILLKEKAG